jgi:hypothetical protein
MMADQTTDWLQTRVQHINGLPMQGTVVRVLRDDYHRVHSAQVIWDAGRSDATWYPPVGLRQVAGRWPPRLRRSVRRGLAGRTITDHRFGGLRRLTR